MSISKLALPYRYQEALMDDIQEYNIEYNSREDSLQRLIGFIKNYENKRINIECTDESILKFPIETMETLFGMFNNIYLRIMPTQLRLLEEIKEIEGIRFFMDYSISAYNYTLLDSHVQAGVSDVYIADDLWNNIIEVSQYCHEHGVGIRTVLNRIPCTAPDKGYNPRSPLFRPQDLSWLNKYVDIYEFDDRSGRMGWTKMRELVNIWFKNGYWHGDLREINKDWEVYLHNDTVYPDLWAYKGICERRCCKRVTSNCHKCEQWMDMARLFDNKGIILKEVKNEEVND